MVRSNQECFIAVDVLAWISYNTGKVHFIHLHLKMKLISNAPYVPLTSLITAFATPSDRSLIGWHTNEAVPPIVDLGHARYQGQYGSTYGLHVWNAWVVPKF